MAAPGRRPHRHRRPALYRRRRLRLPPNAARGCIAPFLPAPGSFSAGLGLGNALAGLCGGLAATLVLHPLDLVKVRLQRP